MTDAVRLSGQGEPDAAAMERLRWTSVPRWAAPELPAAASYLACWFGTAGERRARALLAGADPQVPVRLAAFPAAWDEQPLAGPPALWPPAVGQSAAGAPTEARLRRLFGEAFTGVRIILAGPESLVLRAAAVARQCGAATEELVLLATEATADQYVTGEAERRVFCADCRAVFAAVAALGSTVTCPGCAGRMIVDQRFSRPLAAYFGWPAGSDPRR